MNISISGYSVIPGEYMKKWVFILLMLFIAAAGAVVGYCSTFYSALPAGNIEPKDGDAEAYPDEGSDIFFPEIITKNDFSIAFVGDILFGGAVDNVIKEKGADYLFQDTSKILQSADLAVGNLENPISLSGIPEKDKQFVFRAVPQSVTSLAWAGIDIVSIANNHILDYGKEALEDTFESLELCGIKYAGAGRDVNSASRPVHVEIDGVKVAFVASSHVIPFVSWTAGVNKPGVASAYNPERICSEISKARGAADIVVAYLHWGKERARQPEQYQRNLAKMFINCGADVVVGTHPHVLQGIEFYRGRVIAYSLGNFVFTDSFKNTMILKVTFDKDRKVKSVKVIPCVIRNFKPEPVIDRQKAAAIIDEIRELSYDVDIDEEGIVTPIYK